MSNKDNIMLNDVTEGETNNGDEDSDEWDEMEVNGEQTTCLFCPLQFHTIAVALDHCRSEHDFDLLRLKNKYNMDCYSYIKLINYIRLQKPDSKLLTESSIALWEDDVYLKPGEMETWLMYDFDDLGSAPSTPHYAIDGKTPISNINYSDLQRQIQELTIKLRHRDMLLENCTKDMEKMKEVTRAIVETGDTAMKKNAKDITVGDFQCADYFQSYSHFEIHFEMLNDKIRTEGYRAAILNNTALFAGKHVLDVGCGTGILSMFSSAAGAEKVYGIDQSDVIYKAMDIVRENNLHEKIYLIKGQVEHTNLPVEKVDLIVSEWMGYFLLFEGMLDSVVFARDKFLKPDGTLLPNRCNISLVGVSDTDKYNKLINFWDNVYGFSMTCMKSDVLDGAHVEVVPAEKVITNAAVVTEIDLKTCNSNVCNFVSNFSLKANRSGTLTALAGYFDTFFDLDRKVEFSTGPHVERTHWQQTVFYLKDTVDLKEGDVLSGVISCTRLSKNARGLSITITINNKKYKYRLD